MSVLGGPFLDSLCELLALYDLQLILLGVWQPHPASPDPVCPLGEGWGGPGGMGPDFTEGASTVVESWDAGTLTKLGHLKHLLGKFLNFPELRFPRT